MGAGKTELEKRIELLDVIIGAAEKVAKAAKGIKAELICAPCDYCANVGENAARCNEFDGECEVCGLADCVCMECRKSGNDARWVWLGEAEKREV